MSASRVVVLTPDELRELITEAVAAALGPRAKTDELVPLAAAGVPVRTLRRAIGADELTATKIGREYRIRRADLDAWLEARRVAPRAKREPVQTEADRAIERARRAGALRSIPTRAA